MALPDESPTARALRLLREEWESNLLRDQGRLNATVEHFAAPEVLRAAVWLLRVLSTRGIDVVALLSVLTEELTSDDVDPDALRNAMRPV